MSLKWSKVAAVERLSVPGWLIIDLYLEEVSYKMLNLEMVAERMDGIIYHPTLDLIMLVSLLEVRTTSLILG